MTETEKLRARIIADMGTGIRAAPDQGKEPLLHRHADLCVLLEAVRGKMLTDSLQMEALDRVERSVARVRAAWQAKPEQVRAWHPLAEICTPNLRTDLLIVLELAERHGNKNTKIRRQSRKNVAS